jgi:fatty-acyl-CoA synthase
MVCSHRPTLIRSGSRTSPTTFANGGELSLRSRLADRSGRAGAASPVAHVDELAEGVAVMDGYQLTTKRMLDRMVTFAPEREVVSYDGPHALTLTFGEISSRVNRLAHVLDGLGLSRGDRVATIAWNHHRHLELYLATSTAGFVLHTINLRFTANQITQIVRDAGDAVLFVDVDQVPAVRDVLASLDWPTPVVVMGAAGASEIPKGWLDYEQLLVDASANPYPFPDLSENEIAALCYSSATTGVPKGVEYSHRALYLHTAALCMADSWALSRRDSVLPIVPMFHVNAWGIPFAAVWLGSRVVLPGPRPRMADLATMIWECDVSFAAAVPTVWAGVFDAFEAAGAAPGSLRMVVSGGAPLPAALLDRADRLGVPLIHSYGMTEASPLVLVGRAADGKTIEGGDRVQRLRQGRLVPGLEMAVLREGEPVPWDGQSPGELLLRGPWVAETYRNRPDLARVFDGGWYHSGDVVDVDEDGYTRVVDRMSDLIKSGGEWISTIAIESALSEFPGVRSAAVIGVPDDRWDERPVAYLVSDSELIEAGVRDFLLSRFPRWWLPESILVVDEIPLTSVGKTDKEALRADWKLRLENPTG